MERTEALLLLKDLMAVCDSVRFATAVSLMPTANQRKWELGIKLESREENGCFDKIVRERGVKAKKTENGYTVFWSP
jgi:hypothetical protein